MPTGSMPDIRASGGTYFLGRYRVVDEIGIGGMASVHLARMDGPGGFQKWVAIKKIHPHLVEDESFVQMFLDEARVAARISHPNVATVFDLGKHEDTYWIAMEYLHGEPLREVMRRTEELGTAMPPEIACRVIADAAEGLHAAHELLGKNGEKLGLVHRDVTPHNLFVTYDGVTKVVDFGIAKFSSRMSHTRAGTLKGKLAYMSPEQVHGEGIDRRTDIFALGVVLWELTTGQRLFRMESDLDTLAKVQECNVPRPSTLIRGYPVDLEKIVMKALAKNRGERFRTARELSRALQSLLMRRGLFIASDEVAAYTQSIFTDRIQKREAHLRWAAEVTQTINVDQMLSKPKIGPEFTNSEVQPSGPPKGPPAPVRPAAGMPALPPEPAPPTRNLGGPTPGVPLDLKSTGPSMATAPRPGGPPRPGPKTAPPPRPAAGAPPPPPPVEEEEHPADGDGPTIQALPPMLDPEPLASTRGGMRSEPPTLAAVPSSGTDAPTMMASPGARAGLLADPQPIEPDDFEEDQDETIVANTRNEGGALHAPPSFPAGPMAAPPPPAFPQTGSMSPQVRPPGFSGPVHTGEVAFAETVGLAQQQPTLPPQGHDPHDYGMQPPPQDIYARGRHHTGPSGDFNPRGQVPSQRMQPTVPRMGPVPTYDNRTMTAQRFKRRPPMWVVAALSCSIALLIAGVVIAIVSSTGSPSPPKAGAAGAPGTASGPFTSARSAFNTVVAQPGSSLAPPTTPPAAPTAPPAASPAATAEATAAATQAAAPAQTAAAPPATTAAAAAQPPAPTPRPTSAAPAAVPAVTAVPTPKKPQALGAITVVCMPKCDSIVDNGTPLGPGHIFNRPVPSGRHVLQLSAPNGVKKTLVIEVTPEQTKEVRISMDK